jgi:hypothetical protein
MAGESRKGKMAENNAWSRNLRSESAQPRAVRAREATPAGPTKPAGREGSVPPREARDLYHFQSPWGTEANAQAGRRQELRDEEKILVGEQLKSPELQPLVCLIEARGQGLLRSAREGDEIRDEYESPPVGHCERQGRNREVWEEKRMVRGDHGGNAG